MAVATLVVGRNFQLLSCRKHIEDCGQEHKKMRIKMFDTHFWENQGRWSKASLILLSTSKTVSKSAFDTLLSPLKVVSFGRVFVLRTLSDCFPSEE